MKLIDAERFDFFQLPQGSSAEYAEGAQFVLEALDAAPEIDAVPVVRCRECKHKHLYGYRDGEPLYYCAHIYPSGEPWLKFDENGYCNYGVAKCKSSNIQQQK